MTTADTIAFKRNDVYLRPFNKDDVDLLFKITSNPDLMKYIGGPLSMDKTQDYLKKIISSSTKKGGWWALFERSTMEFAGFTGLVYDSVEDVAELHSVILPRFQRKGLAKQSLEICRIHGEKVGITGLQAFVSSENQAARKLVRSAGMKFKKYIYRKGKPFELYSF